MENETKKSYNPFKMYGSWIGFIIGITGILTGHIFLQPVAISTNHFGDLVLVYNPFFWIAFHSLSRVGFLVVTIITTPVIFFIYGWIINSIFRKSNKLSRIIFASIFILYIMGSFIFSYLGNLENGSKSFNYIDGYIYSKIIKRNFEKLKAETNNLSLINEVLKVASNQSISIDVRIEVLELLESRISLLSSEEKILLVKYLDMLDDYINKQNQLLDLNIKSDLVIKEENQKIISEIKNLKDLLNKY